MKKNRGFFLIFCFLFANFFLFSQQTQNKGVLLSDDIFSYLKSLKAEPKIQNLVSNINNQYPYNIYTSFNENSSSGKTLLFVFKQEDFYTGKDLIKALISTLKTTELNFSTTILFACGENSRLYKEGMIYGTDIFLNSIDSNKNYTAIYFDLSAEQNQITVSSNKIMSPAYLIQNCYNSYFNNSIKVYHPKFYISQINRFNFLYDRNLDTFFLNEIPAIKLSFSSEVELPQQKNVIFSIIETFNSQKTQDWDQHFLMLYLFNTYYLLSEFNIIKLLIFIIFLIAVFIFTLGFFNSFIKFTAWKNIRNLWYLSPVTFLIIYFSFFLGKGLYLPLSRGNTYLNILQLLNVQLILAVIFSSATYLLYSLLETKADERSIDFLILISTFVNQTVFTFFDISLFPILSLFFVTTLFTIIFRKFFSHIYLFLIMICFLLPYVHYFLASSESGILFRYISTNTIYYPITAMILTPIFLLYLRILIKFSTEHSDAKSKIIFSGGAFGIFILIFICLNTASYINLNKNKTVQNKILITKNYQKKININYSDKNIFDDIIRTINIQMEDGAEICDIQIISEEGNPVLYSDFDYEQINSKSAFFRIPTNPPSSLSISYGTSNIPSSIKVTAIYPSEVSDKFLLSEEIITIDERK